MRDLNFKYLAEGKGALFIGNTSTLSPLGRFYRDYKPNIPRSK